MTPCSMEPIVFEDLTTDGSIQFSSFQIPKDATFAELASTFKIRSISSLDDCKSASCGVSPKTFDEKRILIILNFFMDPDIRQCDYLSKHV